MPQTGPRTKRGKAIASRNAFKHGITADCVVVAEMEDRADWEAVRKGVRETINPENYIEEMLAERLALNLWKRRRIDVYQAAATRRWVDDAYSHLQTVDALRRGTLSKGEFTEPGENELHIEQGVRLLAMTDELQKVMRYEAHLHRETLQLLHELEAMKTRREGGAAPLARLDITGAPGG